MNPLKELCGTRDFHSPSGLQVVVLSSTAARKYILPREHGRGPEASADSIAPANPLSKTLSRGTAQALPKPLTPGNEEIINMRCFKPLSLYNLLHSNRKLMKTSSREAQYSPHWDYSRLLCIQRQRGTQQCRTPAHLK